MQKDYTKLGGWLLFFAICNIISIGLNLFSAVTYFSLGLALDAILLCLIPAVLCLGVVFFIFRRNDKTRFLYLGESVYMILINAFLLFTGGVETTTGTSTLVSSICACVIWFLYFTKSRRVAVYMHPEQAVNENAQQPSYTAATYGTSDKSEQ